jgi:hypothetical protein
MTTHTIAPIRRQQITTIRRRFSANIRQDAGHSFTRLSIIPPHEAIIDVEIRARFDESTVRIYQAYPAEIARPALAAGRLVVPFKLSRMTWIKPSFNWMMYRSGYATKPAQELVLGIDITRKGFEWRWSMQCYQHSILAFIPRCPTGKSSCTRSRCEFSEIQNATGRLQLIEDVRAIQIGLSGDAVSYYVNDWITHIEDVTQTARSIARHVHQFVPQRIDCLELVRPDAGGRAVMYCLNPASEVNDLPAK